MSVWQSRGQTRNADSIFGIENCYRLITRQMSVIISLCASRQAPVYQHRVNA
jgi:hypothetical protein